MNGAVARSAASRACSSRGEDACRSGHSLTANVTLNRLRTSREATRCKVARMSEETSNDTAREPWPGYAKLSPDARRGGAEKKFGAARDRGDRAYAFALAAAVANYEQVQKLRPGTQGAEPVAAK